MDTGDLFVRDDDGYFWYRGRSDDLIKVGGIWVAPSEVEHCLVAHADVVECAVVGYEEGGLTLTRAHVVLAPGSPPRTTWPLRSRNTCATHLSPHKYPRDVRFVAELPKTPSGKIDRRALRAEVEVAA